MYQDVQEAIMELHKKYPMLNSLRFHKTNVIVIVVEKPYGHEKFWRSNMDEVLLFLENYNWDGR